MAATSGIHQGEDVIKTLLAGADVAMMATALLEQGPQHLRQVLEEVEAWLGEREYESVTQMKGSVSQMNCPDPGVLRTVELDESTGILYRETYMKRGVSKFLAP